METANHTLVFGVTVPKNDLKDFPQQHVHAKESCSCAGFELAEQTGGGKKRTREDVKSNSYDYTNRNILSGEHNRCISF